jgi:signal transduction histidine kinase
LDDLGLLSALTWYFDRYTTQFKIEARFQHAGLERRRFEPDIETAAYRIVQEALTNVARHARVDRVEVRISADENTLSIRITDTGVGFEPDSLSVRATGGLSGMRERAILLGGRLQLESSPGHGTSLTAELPLKRTAAGESAPAIHS